MSEPSLPPNPAHVRKAAKIELRTIGLELSGIAIGLMSLVITGSLHVQSHGYTAPLIALYFAFTGMRIKWKVDEIDKTDGD